MVTPVYRNEDKKYVGEPFYPGIQDAIKHMGFDRSVITYNLKVCLAAACFALVQTPYAQHPQFLDANGDENGRKLLYYFTIIVKFINRNGEHIKIPISLHSDPAFVYYAILEEMGVYTEPFRPKSIEKKLVESLKNEDIHFYGIEEPGVPYI